MSTTFLLSLHWTVALLGLPEWQWRGNHPVLIHVSISPFRLGTPRGLGLLAPHHWGLRVQHKRHPAENVIWMNEGSCDLTQEAIHSLAVNRMGKHPISLSGLTALVEKASYNQAQGHNYLWLQKIFITPGHHRNWTQQDRLNTSKLPYSFKVLPSFFSLSPSCIIVDKCQYLSAPHQGRRWLSFIPLWRFFWEALSLPLPSPS